MIKFKDNHDTAVTGGEKQTEAEFLVEQLALCDKWGWDRGPFEEMLAKISNVDVTKVVKNITKSMEGEDKDSVIKYNIDKEDNAKSTVHTPLADAADHAAGEEFGKVGFGGPSKNGPATLLVK